MIPNSFTIIYLYRNVLYVTGDLHASLLTATHRCISAQLLAILYFGGA